MHLSPKERILLQAVREAGTDIGFLLIHLANLYERQLKLDLQAGRANAGEMKRRAALYCQAFYEASGLSIKEKKGGLRLIVTQKKI